MQSDTSETPRRRNLLVFFLVGLIVTIAIAVVFATKVESAYSVFQRDGLSGVYYVVKDKFSWSSPNVQWPVAEPEDLGIDPRNLDKIWATAQAAETSSLLIAKNGQIVFERYGESYSPNRRSSIGAMGKAITASMVLMLAVDDGLVKLDDRMQKYLPEWNEDDRKRAISIRHIVTHSSGIDDVNFGNGGRSGWKEVYYDNPADRFSMALSVAPVKFDPGEQFGYSGVAFYALAYVLAKRYHETSVPDLRDLLDDRLMAPLGVPKHDWEISYGDVYELDGVRMYALGSGGSYTARAIARIGQLLLNEGQWDGRQLVRAGLVREMLSFGGLQNLRQAEKTHPVAGGLGTWSNCDGYWPSLPRDASLALGGPHNFLLVVPSLQLLVVRQGGHYPKQSPSQEHWEVLGSAVFEDLMEALPPQDRAETPHSCYRENSQD